MSQPVHAVGGRKGRWRIPDGIQPQPSMREDGWKVESRTTHNRAVWVAVHPSGNDWTPPYSGSKNFQTREHATAAVDAAFPEVSWVGVDNPKTGIVDWVRHDGWVVERLKSGGVRLLWYIRPPNTTTTTGSGYGTAMEAREEVDKRHPLGDPTATRDDLRKLSAELDWVE